MRNERTKLYVPVLVTAVILGAAWRLQSTVRTVEAPRAPAPIMVSMNSAPTERQARAVTSFAPVVRKVAPAVVNVFSSKRVKHPPISHLPLFDDPLLGELFGGEGGRDSPTLTEQNLGSGAIVTADGYILTNSHVVGGAEEIKVTLAPGNEDYSAQLVGRDPKTDLAVVKIEARDLPAVTFGNSDEVQVGDVVLALGNPFGVGQTVTNGIVSAVNRSGLGTGDYEDFIQTDAPINPGNSGGPLIDIGGRLIGVNTAIISRTGSSTGVGFAVPVNVARYVLEQIIKHGKVARGTLGISIQDLTPGLAAQFKAPTASGALVGDVKPGGAAAAAGIESGDIITEFDHEVVIDGRALRTRVAEAAPGTKIELKVLRDGKPRTLPVTLREAPQRRTVAKQSPPPSRGDMMAGVMVGELSEPVRAELKIPEGVKGVIVLQVVPGSPASLAGLHEGDVIQSINRRPINASGDATKAVRDGRGKPVLLRVWSRGKSGYLLVGER